MSSTNHTTNYNLPQFVGTDKPAWLGDINPAMSAIDTQMKNNADGIAGILSMFNLTSTSSKQASALISISGVSTSGNFRLAQNNAGSIFKFYNNIRIVNTNDSTINIPLTAIPGMNGWYGLKVLQLNELPSEGYYVASAGTYTFSENEGANLQDVSPADFIVGSDGYVYILGSYISSWGVHGHQQIKIFFPPCIYFNANFGDQ